MKEYLLSSLTKAGHLFDNKFWSNSDKLKSIEVRMIIETIRILIIFYSILPTSSRIERMDL